MIARHRDDDGAVTVSGPTGRPSAMGSVPRTGRSARTSGKTETPPPKRAGDGPAGADGGRGASASAPKKGSRWVRPTVVNAKLIYAGYLASLAIPFLAIISAVFAWQSAKHDPPAWLATHYAYQLRTFWIGLVANLIAYALSFAGVGLLLFPLIAVWVVARSVKGLIRVARQHEIEDPNSYFV